MSHTGRTRTAGVLGWPVHHSLSPQLHAHWFARYGIDAAFVPFPVAPERVAEAVAGLRALGMVGGSVTLPHKQAVIDHLDVVDPQARRIGAVNTIVVDPDGRLVGCNTDAGGFLDHLRQSTPGWRPDAGAQVVVGAGGAARAILVALADAGATRLRLVNRTNARGHALAASLDLAAEVVDWADRQQALGDAGLLVNATTQGMVGQPALAIDPAALPAAAIVYDIVYTPEDTPLLTAARACNLATVDGIGMLLHQARGQFRAWFGVDPAVDAALKRAVLG